MGDGQLKLIPPGGPCIDEGNLECPVVPHGAVDNVHYSVCATVPLVYSTALFKFPDSASSIKGPSAHYTPSNTKPGS